MGFATTSILDDFNRANEGPPPSSNWSGITTTTNTLKVTSNQLDVDSTDIYGFGSAYWNPASFGADSEAYLTIATKPTDGAGNLRVGARMAGVGDIFTFTGYFYFFEPAAGTDTIKITRIDTGGVETVLGATISQEVAAGEKLGLEVIGTTIKVFHNSGSGWSDISSGGRTDATYGSAGRIGLLSNDITSNYDDFGGGTVLPYTQTQKLMMMGIGQ